MEEKGTDMKKRIRAVALMVCAAMMALGAYAPLAQAGEPLGDIVYTGTKNEFVAAGSEVFSQVDNGLPGDVFAGKVTVTNASEGPCEVFACARDVVASGPEDLLERIPLTVKASGNVAYEGALAEASAAEPVSLGVLQVGQTLDMDCMAVIPSELTNEYADAAVGMNMVVTVEDREAGGSTGLVPTGPNGSGSTGAGLVHAGDALCAGLLILGTLAAAGAVIWCAWKRRMRMW